MTTNNRELVKGAVLLGIVVLVVIVVFYLLVAGPASTERWLNLGDHGCPGRTRLLPRYGSAQFDARWRDRRVATKIISHRMHSVFDRDDITREEDLADASRKLKRSQGQSPGQKRNPMRLSYANR
jgi:hypothetical protein